MFDAVYSHVQPYLTKLQYGFMKRRSTILQLLELTDRVYHALYSNKLSHVEIVFLDFAKAFDKVDHSVLTRKLWQWGFGGELFAVLKDYLRNKRQRVKLNGVLSDCLEVTSGVPQGSLLGPLLFLLFINDLPDCVREALPGLFADDVELFVAYENDTEDPVVDDLFRLKTWADENKMMFSADKCKSLVLKCSRDAPGHHRENLPITLHSAQKEKYLGVTITSSFSWSPHIKERCGKAMQSFFLIKRNSSSSLSFLSKLNLYKSLIVPILLYGHQVWNANNTDYIIIERVQRRVTTWILAESSAVPYKDRLHNLKLLPLLLYMQLHDVLFLSKVLNSNYDFD